MLGLKNAPKFRVLWLEDSSADELLFKRMLKPTRICLEFEFVCDEREFKRVLSDRKNILPDFIFLDLNVPSADGVEMIDWLKKCEQTRAIPIFVVTGASEDWRRVVALGIPRERYLVKPYDLAGFSTFGREIEELLISARGELCEKSAK
jgi:CheY-like chemotaxis protein